MKIALAILWVDVVVLSGHGCLIDSMLGGFLRAATCLAGGCS